MSNDLDTDTDEQQQSVEVEESPPFKLLRDQRNSATERAEAAERKLTLHEAGLGNLSTMQMAALEGAHKNAGGEWDAEALKTTAAELGFVQSDSGQPAPKVSPEELAAHDRVAAAAGGHPAPPPGDLDAEIAAVSKDDPKGAEKITEILRRHGRLAGED